MEILIRADCGNKISTGHIHRCLNLASYFSTAKAKPNITFITKLTTYESQNNNIYKLIESYGFKVLTLLPGKSDITSDNITWFGEDYLCDADKMISVLKESKYDILIVDQYAADYKWETQLRPYVNKILVIDDHYTVKHNCDILINQQVSDFHKEKIMEQKNNLPNNCQLLCGTEYLLMSKKFYDLSRHVRIHKKIKRINIFTGGSDQHSETLRILSVCQEVLLQNPLLKFDIIVGSLNRDLQKIRELCYKTNAFYFYETSPDFFNTLNQADLCIGGAGMTMYERVYLNLPSIVIKLADNQQNGIDQLQSYDCLEFIGDSGFDFDRRLSDAFRKLLKCPSRCAELSMNCNKIQFSTPYNIVKKIMDIINTSSPINDS